jgi:hypothetical protein
MANGTMKIGITIFPPKTGFAFFSNGAHQNVAFLWLLLRAAGHDVALVNGGDGDPPRPKELPAPLREIRFVRIGDVVESLDVLIEAGAQMASEDIAKVRSRGGRAVAYKFGSALPIDAEHAIHNLPNNSGIFNGAQFDEVWTTDQHASICGGYWSTCYRAPVRVLPFVWEPCFVEETLEALPPNLPRGYKPGRTRKRIAICEPNINLIKTAHVPMLIAERVFRGWPELVERVLVTNAIHLRDRLSFSKFAGALDATRAKGSDGHPVMSFEPRFRTPWFLPAHADVLVSHQWISVPNYLLMDALFMGFPVVHNVPGMPGYAYTGFDVNAGAAALLRAMTEHDAHAAEYREGARSWLQQRRATAPHNIEAHARALAEVIGS